MFVGSVIHIVAVIPGTLFTDNLYFFQGFNVDTYTAYRGGSLVLLIIAFYADRYYQEGLAGMPRRYYDYSYLGSIYILYIL